MAGHCRFIFASFGMAPTMLFIELKRKHVCEEVTFHVQISRRSSRCFLVVSLFSSFVEKGQKCTCTLTPFLDCHFTSAYVFDAVKMYARDYPL